MRIRHITRAAYVALFCLAAVTGVSMTLMTQAINAERTASERAAEFRQLGLDLAAASDFLTNEARRYAGVVQSFAGAAAQPPASDPPLPEV